MAYHHTHETEPEKKKSNGIKLQYLNGQFTSTPHEMVMLSFHKMTVINSQSYKSPVGRPDIIGFLNKSLYNLIDKFKWNFFVLKCMLDRLISNTLHENRNFIDSSVQSGNDVVLS